MRFLILNSRVYAACLIAATVATIVTPAFAQNDQTRPDPQALFNTLDTDQSGTLDRSELSRLPSLMAAQRAARIDTNNDGQIDKAEYETAAKDRADHRFARMDRDGDGQIGVDALDARHGHHGHTRRHKRDNKAGSDKPAHKGMFQAIDTDGNGAVSPEEWQTAATRWHHHHGADHGDTHPDDA